MTWEYLKSEPLTDLLGWLETYKRKSSTMQPEQSKFHVVIQMIDEAGQSQPKHMLLCGCGWSATITTHHGYEDAEELAEFHMNKAHGGVSGLPTTQEPSS